MAALNFLVLRTFVVLHIPVAHCDWWERNLAWRCEEADAFRHAGMAGQEKPSAEVPESLVATPYRPWAAE